MAIHVPLNKAKMANFPIRKYGKGSKFETMQIFHWNLCFPCSEGIMLLISAISFVNFYEIKKIWPNRPHGFSWCIFDQNSYMQLVFCSANNFTIVGLITLKLGSSVGKRLFYVKIILFDCPRLFWGLLGTRPQLAPFNFRCPII